MIQDRAKPTRAQIDYATVLINALGYDLDDYDFDKMTRSEMARLIDDLKAEWEG